MSQTQNNPKLVKLNQILTELIPPGPDFDAFQKVLGDDSSLILQFEEFVGDIKEFFKDVKITFRHSEKLEETGLLIAIEPNLPLIESQVKFNEFKRIWWQDKYELLRENVSMKLEHPDTYIPDDPWEIFNELVGSIEGPEDLAMEHDHYLYGTPKKHQK